ncbi:MAG: alkaline phosphatase family protein [Planctomycetota bacterium]
MVLGFDGVDPDVVERYFADGDLPNLKRLAEMGSFSALGTTNPAESPVSWAAFSIGANPGKTGIFDFLYRIPDTYVPDIALVRRGTYELGTGLRVCFSAVAGTLGAMLLLVAGLPFRRRLGRRGILLPPLAGLLLAGGGTFTVFQLYIPRSIPRALPARQGTPFWESAGDSGMHCSILQVPVTFPAAGFSGGRLVTGLGTPDVRQTWGTFSIYAERFPEEEELSDPGNSVDPRVRLEGFGDSVTGGKLIQVEFPSGPQAQVETILHGPRDFTRGDRDFEEHPELPREICPPLHIAIDREQERATFRVGGREVSARAGGWTEWLEVDFRLNPIIALEGIVRFRVRSVDPFYAYGSPVNFHPAKPPFIVPLSAPAGFSREVTERTGQLHETVGWAIATNPLKDELISEEEFLEDLYFTLGRRWRIIEKELERDDWRLVVGVMLAPDRVQHMFWHTIDPGHPLHDPGAPESVRNAIRDVYREMDRIVGVVMERHLDERTDLWVISDHGFASFRKGVHVNSWLVEEGYMTLIDPAERRRGRLTDIFEQAPFANVDWSRTRAYSLGLGKIYLNRLGREPEGTVETPEEAEAITDEIIDRLEALRDPETGARVVERVYRSDEIFSGPHLDEAGDLVIGFAEGYRVSWDTAAGKAPPGIVETNLNKWSGAHCSVDPSVVPGFLVTNRKVTVGDPAIVDVARTILGILGVSPPREMEGRDLLR